MNILQIVFHVIVIIRINYGTSISKIVDGYDCRARDYPYLISLSTLSTGFFCGGSLVNRYNVLTAGHCCDYRTCKEQIKVYAGVSERKSHVQTARVWKRIIHPNPTVDLCILKLFTPIEYTSGTSFAKLANIDMLNQLKRDNSMQQCITLGFGFQGTVQFDGTVENYTPAKKLHCVHQKVIQRCYASSHLLCVVGADRPTQDACKGDSGSPLICGGIQVGFVVSGTGCGLGFESHYMNISAVYDYIQGVARGNLLCEGVITLISLLCCFNILFKIQ